MTFAYSLSALTVRPDAPDIPQADRITKDSVTISWRPPRNDGGARIKGYLVQKKGKGDADWTEVNGVPCPTTVYKVYNFILKMKKNANSES